MVAKVQSATVVGIDGVAVDVETHIIGALKRFALVGLPDGVLREAKDRVRCAIENSGFHFPNGEVVVNLAPAWLQKRGSGFDLAIALSILAADGQLPAEALRGKIVLAELALDGCVKPVIGELAAALQAKKQQANELILAAEQAGRAACLEDVRVVGIAHLRQAVEYLKGGCEVAPAVGGAMIAEQTLSQPGFGDVVGQQSAKRALEIAAAGGHNILMVGPPGSGKSMLARRLPALLPPLSREEAIQVSQIYTTIAPRVPDTRPDSLIIYRPFRAPHHSLSTSALVGGGRPPQPGEISLAHRGVLFLDEVPELRRDALEALRMPLEDQRVDICRAAQRVRFPADFVLVAAMNPCPCGRFGLSGGRGCRCLARDRQRYANKLSGPIRDRIDLHLWVAPVPVEQLQSPPAEDPTEQMRARVASARTLQTERYGAAGVLNARVTAERLKEHCQLDSASKKLLQAAAERFNLSARAYTRVLRVARSIADLAGAVNILPEHLAEAVRYREQPALDE